MLVKCAGGVLSFGYRHISREPYHSTGAMYASPDEITDVFVSFKRSRQVSYHCLNVSYFERFKSNVAAVNLGRKPCLVIICHHCHACVLDSSPTGYGYQACTLDFETVLCVP